MSANLLCTPADVRDVLSGATIDLTIDITDASLLLLGTSTLRAGLIPAWSRRFEQLTRDFDYVQHGTVTINGSGTNALIMPAKYTPIITLRSVRIRGASAYQEDDFILDEAEAGVIKLQESLVSGFGGYYGGNYPYPPYGGAIGYFSRQGYPRFPKGVGNVTVNLEYGFENGSNNTFLAPADVRLAVASKVAMAILNYEASSDRRGAGVLSLRISYYSEQFGKKRWEGFMEELENNWKQAARLWKRGLTAS